MFGANLLDGHGQGHLENDFVAAALGAHIHSHSIALKIGICVSKYQESVCGYLN